MLPAAAWLKVCLLWESVVALPFLFDGLAFPVEMFILGHRPHNLLARLLIVSGFRRNLVRLLVRLSLNLSKMVAIRLLIEANRF